MYISFVIIYISAQWLKTLSLPDGITQFDLNLVNTFYNRYLNQTSNGSKKWQNLTVKLDTSEVRGHIFKTKVKMIWPTLLAENKTVFSFPLTQVGNFTFQNISIKNPSSYNLIVQIVLDVNYPELHGLYEGLPPNLISQDLQKQKKPSIGFFFHKSYKLLQENFFRNLDLEFHRDTIPVFLKPGEIVTFRIGFRTEDATHSSAAILLRNNLTMLEVVKIDARAVHPNFKFGNRRPGSTQPLSFELTEKHLKDCEREKHRKYPSPNLTVKRSFTARNTGDVTVFVNGFSINGIPCEGYGFKVLNCEAFYLLPNATRKIDIAFTPDFTLAKITRSLMLETSLNFPVNYTLLTTVPSYYLALCSTVLLRPAWEAYLYYTSVCLMCFLLIFVVLAPVMDSERILKQTLGLVITRSCPSTQPTLDLRLVGQQTRSEIRQKVDAEVTENKNKDNKTCTKICALMDEPVKPVKQEQEKQVVLVPTVGKQKKKVAKKLSNEIGEMCEKKSSPEPQKAHKASNKQTEVIENDVKKHSPKEHRKIAQNKKITNKPTECKTIDVPVCEEETSSTTTESSNNEEDQHKNIKPTVKKQSSPKIEYNNMVYIPAPPTPVVQIESTHQNHAKIERKSSGPKQNKLKEYAGHRSSAGGKMRTGRNSRDCKDKQILSRKPSRPTEHSTTSVSPTVRTSPSIPSSSFWSENRATFSDVVARSDTNSYPINAPRYCFNSLKESFSDHYSGFGEFGNLKIFKYSVAL